MRYRLFKDLPCGYQLHYHFCFQTKYNQRIFAGPERRARLADSLSSICDRNGYHLLGNSIEDDRLYCLISLKPDHIIAAVSRILKTLAREFNLHFPVLAAGTKDRALWSIGYYVGGVGKASKESARRYIEKQGEHHGIRDERSRKILRWVNPRQSDLSAAHVTFDLSYHVVLVTSGRTEVFDEYIAPGLFEALTISSQKNGFYIERMSVLYDHIHMLLKLTPSLGIKDCILELMNDSWQFMADKYAGVLKNTGAYNVWTESFYVSTVGQATTAQVKSFLGEKRTTTGSRPTASRAWSDAG
jgi:putative transposase